MAEPGGRAVEHNVVLPVTASGSMIGVKPQFSGRSLADGANAVFDVVAFAPDGASMALRGLHYELLRIETHYQFYKQNGHWNYEPVKTTKRVADGTIDTTLDKPSHISLPVNFGRYRLEVSSGDPNGPVTSIAFDAGFYVETNADTPDMLEVALDKSDYAPGDTMTVAVTARTRGPPDAQCHRRPAVGDANPRRPAGRGEGETPGRQRLEHRRLSGRDAATAARRAGTAHAGPRHRGAMVLDRSRGKDACRRPESRRR